LICLCREMVDIYARTHLSTETCAYLKTRVLYIPYACLIHTLYLYMYNERERKIHAPPVGAVGRRWCALRPSTCHKTSLHAFFTRLITKRRTEGASGRRIGARCYAAPHTPSRSNTPSSTKAKHSATWAKLGALLHATHVMPHRSQRQGEASASRLPQITRVLLRKDPMKIGLFSKRDVVI